MKQIARNSVAQDVPLLMSSHKRKGKRQIKIGIQFCMKRCKLNHIVFYINNSSNIKLSVQRRYAFLKQHQKRHVTLPIPHLIEILPRETCGRI